MVDDTTARKNDEEEKLHATEIVSADEMALCRCVHIIESIRDMGMGLGEGMDAKRIDHLDGIAHEWLEGLTKIQEIHGDQFTVVESLLIALHACNDVLLSFAVDLRSLSHALKEKEILKKYAAARNKPSIGFPVGPYKQEYPS